MQWFSQRTAVVKQKPTYLTVIRETKPFVNELRTFVYIIFLDRGSEDIFA